MIESYDLLGIRIDNLDESTPAPDAYEEDSPLIALLKRGLFKKGNVVAYLDIHKLLKARKDARLKEIFANAFLVLPADGFVRWGVKALYGVDVPTIDSVKVMHDIFLLAEKRKYSFFVFGSETEYLMALSKRLKHYFPHVGVVGTYPEKIPPGWEEKVLEGIRKASPHFLLVAKRFPKDYYWIDDTKEKTRANVCIGAEDAINVFSGRVKPMPEWIVKLKLEWLYRLITKPWHIFFVFKYLYFFLLVLFEGGRRKRAVKKEKRMREKARRAEEKKKARDDAAGARDDEQEH